MDRAPYVYVRPAQETDFHEYAYINPDNVAPSSDQTATNPNYFKKTINPILT